MFLYNYLPFFKKKKQDQDTNKICYSGGIRRFSSILIDLTILIFILQIIHNVYSYFFMHETDNTVIKIIEKYKMSVPLTAQEEQIKNKHVFKAICGQIIQMIALYIYAAYSWTKFSATLGKFLTGLRVVDATTFQKITLSQSTKRIFGSILSSIPLCLGIVWCNFNKRKQTWHDKIANTVVVTNKSLKNYHNNHNL
ncbi:RDD family protein [Ehrlichia chaffeensis str. Heartland]|uniref:RDD family protein n=1 Tax=Ehrlichia chaffeensis (strain ATCC CRL-10679 / Arkansas) TaxID=205920 RepID=Q2GGI0_EHRCR|nr:RDD family protein [Ehrlichia chaffeensis]ABD45129.1 RDD family protein [Ehrlichia chaffeensis str. Arkansas]AHX03724.1 RDD family protein [Ehrlichia chaffeensis str. Heartland]AHX05555.1 RDD family protein [Ehrlichia chaffeensis str. Jax]AHX06545.1 RDD family protein [Ehrlichia chaffeensis str. Liberty]AHX07375.1 RDD family protein [Ehrlichia chaffeensis str. Osceola]